VAIAFRAVGTGGNGTGGPASVAPAKPAGTVSTDILVCIICSGGGTLLTITPPSGWTLIKRQDNGTTSTAAAYWALGSVASSTFTLSGSVDAVSAIIAGYTGVDNTTPMDATGVGQNNAASTTVTSPSITTVTANAQIVFLGAPYDPTRTSPGTWTTVFGTVRGSTGIRGASVDASEVVIADAVQASAGASGAKTETYSLSKASGAITAALRPAAGASFNLDEDFWAPPIPVDDDSPVTVWA
jgi:hypothetical protein